MRDIMGMMGKVKEMQAKMEKMQEEISSLEVDGSSGGGLVTLRMDGKDKAEAITAEKTRELTAGLPIPPGMKLPF